MTQLPIARYTSMNGGIMKYVIGGLLLMCVAGAFSAYVSAKVVENKVDQLCADMKVIQQDMRELRASLREAHIKLSNIEGQHRGRQ